jgi:hypothetical protein
MMGKKSKDKFRRGYIFLDWENLWKNLENFLSSSYERFSPKDWLNRLIEQIGQEEGQVIKVYVFVPLHLASSWAETFYNLGFFTIACPKIRGKAGEEIDTTDRTLMSFAETLIDETRELTFICIGSGDQDFIPLANKARDRGLRVIAAVASWGSLSSEFGKKVKKTYLFSPTVEGI